MRRTAVMLATLSLVGCGYGASRQAHEAQISMVGMTSADLLACAGPPAKSTKINDEARVDTYTYTPPASSGFTLNLPLSLGGVAIGSSGNSCIANFRLVNNRVTEVHYAGPDDLTLGDDGVCDPVIRGCVREPEGSLRPVTGHNYGQSSAFTAPAVPRQPLDGEETEAAPTTTVTPKK